MTNGKFWDASKEQLKKYEENWNLEVIYKEKKVYRNKGYIKTRAAKSISVNCI